MKFLIFGGTGKIGSAIAWDLAKDREIESVGIVGRHQAALAKTKRWVGSDKVVAHVLDISDEEGTKKLMARYDVGVIALPDRRTSYKVVEAAIGTGLNIVDILEEYHRRPDPYETEGLKVPEGMTIEEYGKWLHKRAVANNVLLIDGIGFAPGLSNITVGEGIRKFGKVETAVARVGGIPSKKAAAKHPLGYIVTWAFAHVLREYMVAVMVIKNGKPVEVEAMSDYERFRFTQLGRDEELECFVTPGMPSFLSTRPQLKDFSEKTIRWPGHWQGIQTLKGCGLLDLTPVKFGGMKVVPREFLVSVLEPQLYPSEGDTDVCVMWNTVTGTKDGRRMHVDYYMWEEADTRTGISAMARVTGFSAAIAARFLAEGKIKGKGLVPPEDCIGEEVYEEFMKELKKRDITILEVLAAG